MQNRSQIKNYLRVNMNTNSNIFEQDGSQTTSITRDYRLTTLTYNDSSLNLNKHVYVQMTQA